MGPDLVLLFLRSRNHVLFTAPDSPSATACLCFTDSVSVFLSLPVCLSVCSLSLPSSHASVRCSMVEDPSPVSGNKAPPVGSPSGQGPVPLSVICWYRVQSLSFSESCRSMEVKEPGRQEEVYFNAPQNNHVKDVTVRLHVVQSRGSGNI